MAPRTTAHRGRSPPRGPTTTLSRTLAAVVAATVIPLLAFVAAVTAWSSYNYQEAGRAALERTARALSLVVDEQVVTWEAALTTLSTSPALDEGDYATFRRQAETVTARFGGWLIVSLPSGRQVVDTRRPDNDDEATPSAADPPVTVIPDGRTHVTDVFFGPGTNRPTIAITVPSLRNGTVTHTLRLGLLPEDLAALLGKQSLPDGWLAALVSEDNRVITRTTFDAGGIGEAPPDWFFRAAAMGADNGTVRGRSATGMEMYGAYNRLTQAPWILVIAGPSREIAPVWQRPLFVLAGGGIAFVIAIMTVLILMGRRLANSINALAGAAQAAMQGRALPAVPASTIREIGELRSAVMALSQKQALLREVNHRIKNSLQIVSATLDLQGRMISDDTVRAHFSEAQAHLRAVARLHERLYKTEEYKSVEAFALARAVCEDVAAISAGRAKVRIDTEGAAHIGTDAGGSFALIVVELVTNAVKHAATAGQAATVDVRCRIEDGPTIAVVVSDNGPGLPPGFDLATQKGMGLRMALALSTQIGGTLRTVPASSGAVFELRVPVAAQS